jgi:lactocepin
MTALVLQYVKETFPEGTDYRRVAQDLLMSTAEPLSYNESIAYSPRSQGAGLGNAFNAVTTNAYLTVPGADSVKADLGDDADRTGAYSFSFDIVNFSDAPAYYRLNTTVQTEDHLELARGLYFMAGTPRLLGAAAAESSANMVLTYDVDEDGDTDSHDAYIIYQTAVNGAELAESFRCDVDVNEAVAAADVQAYLDALVGNDSKADLEDTVLQVAAGETASVTVNVNLTAEDKAYFATYWENGKAEPSVK